MLFVVGELVGVKLGRDCRVPWLALLVLVQHPLQSGPVPQTVLPSLLRNVCQRGAFVQSYCPSLLVRPQDGPAWINPLSVMTFHGKGVD